MKYVGDKVYFFDSGLKVQWGGLFGLLEYKAIGKINTFVNLTTSVQADSKRIDYFEITLSQTGNTNKDFTIKTGFNYNVDAITAMCSFNMGYLNVESKRFQFLLHFGYSSIFPT
ncbi:MAG: hypothetical protein U0Z17_07065 [Bacteroidales bacterium]